MLDNPHGFSTESKLSQTRSSIDALWATRTEGRLAGVAGISIAFAYVVPHSYNGQSIVLVPGRTEFIHKYTETVFDLCRQGYSVYVMDHRGQGLSERLLRDQHKGHVDSFDFYVEDLQRFITEVVQLRETRSPVLMGHSMGGAVAARHLQCYPGVAVAGALLSPMLEINTGAPQALVWPLVERIEALLSPYANEPGYIPGGDGYSETAYKKYGRLNNLTHSEVRLAYLNKQYAECPQIQLGSPTRQWLLQAFAAMETILNDVEKIKVPVSLVASGSDRIVRQGGQNDFLESLRNTGKNEVDSLFVEDAEHELLLEADEYRIPALNHLLGFLKGINEPSQL